MAEPNFASAQADVLHRLNGAVERQPFETVTGNANPHGLNDGIAFLPVRPGLKASEAPLVQEFDMRSLVLFSRV
jgi:hypothetical protein